jgi:hypothetical protein
MLYLPPPPHQVTHSAEVSGVKERGRKGWKEKEETETKAEKSTGEK